MGKNNIPPHWSKLGPTYSVRRIYPVAGVASMAITTMKPGKCLGAVRAFALDCPGEHVVIGHALYEARVKSGGRMSCYVCSEEEKQRARTERAKAAAQPKPKAVAAPEQRDQMGDVLRVLTGIADGLSRLGTRVEALEDSATRPNGATGPALPALELVEASRP